MLPAAHTTQEISTLLGQASRTSYSHKKGYTNKCPKISAFFYFY